MAGLLIIVLSLLVCDVSFAPWISLEKFAVRRYEGSIPPGGHVYFNLTDLVESNYTCRTALIFYYYIFPRGEVWFAADAHYKDLTREGEGMTAWLWSHGFYEQGGHFAGLLTHSRCKEFYALLENLGDERFNYILEVGQAVICAKPRAP